MKTQISFKQLFVLLLILAFSIAKTGLLPSQEAVTPNFLLKQNPRKSSVCLNMIVKNETAVICRCLESVKPLIDYWVIVDTGSSDGTQEMIRQFMKGIPGELHERPWKNFAHNRNEALELARSKADYLLFIDADEVFKYEPGFAFPELTDDCYFIQTHFNNVRYGRVQLIKTAVDWNWQGVLHEGLFCTKVPTRGHIEGIYDYVRTDGARSQDPKKFEKDAAILEAALKENPLDTRNVYYLAQSYRDAGHPLKAIEQYKRRASMGGWDEEVFCALLQVAVLSEQANNGTSEQIVKNYYDAFQKRTSRAEPLYYLANYYRKKDDFAACYAISKFGMQIAYPKDLLFVEQWIYDYGLLLENSVAAYWLGKYEECKQVSKKILEAQELPDFVKLQVEKNIAYAEEKLRAS